MRAGLYARLSRNKNGLSTNTKIQLDETGFYAEDRGWLIVERYTDDDISASRYSTKPRPGYLRLINDIGTNRLDAVVITEMTRLYRRLEELLDLIRLAETTSLKMIVTTDGMAYDLSTGEGIHQAIGAVNNAMLESRRISDRTRRKQAVKAKQGLSHGGRRAFGYEPGNMLLREPEAAVLREMAARLLAGHSYKEVAYWANEAGHKTAEGKKWHPITVRNSLQRKRYGGIRVHHGSEYPAQWPGVFDPETWQRLELTTRMRAKAKGGRPAGRRYLLTGLVFCGKCGLPLNGATKRDHPGRPLRRTYHCRVNGDTQRQRGCGGVVRNADALEDFVLDTLIFRLDTDYMANLLQRENPDDDKLRGLLTKRAVVSGRIEEILDDYATGQITKEEKNRTKTRAEQELTKLDAQIDELNRRRHAYGLLPAGQTIREAWESSESDSWRRQILALVIDRIILKPGITKPYYKNRWRFDPELVEIKWLC